MSREISLPACKRYEIHVGVIAGTPIMHTNDCARAAKTVGLVRSIAAWAVDTATGDVVAKNEKATATGEDSHHV